MTVGVDIHADVHVAAVVDHLGGVLGVEAFETTESGQLEPVLPAHHLALGIRLRRRTASTALTTAHTTHNARIPVMAWIAEHHQPSRRVAERVGMQNLGLHIDTNDGQQRVAYADREPPPA